MVGREEARVEDGARMARRVELEAEGGLVRVLFLVVLLGDGPGAEDEEGVLESRLEDAARDLH
eukprot:3813749-Prymnesium_polylepis.1